jgi:predicted ester cyclase
MALIQRSNPERRIRRFNREVFGDRNVDAIDEFLSEDCEVFGYGSGHEDREGYKRVMRWYLEAFPDMEIEMNEVLREGDTVVVRWTATGTHTASLHFVGPDGHGYDLGPTGRHVSVDGVDIYRFDGKRISEVRGHFDRLELFAQLGMLSAEGLRHVPELVRSRLAPTH